MKQRSQKKQYESVLEYCVETGAVRARVAAELKVSRFRMAGLLYPDRDPVDVDDDLAARIARLLNQSVAHVRKLHPRKVAA